eukprot:gb/GECG01013887.1/.p1 GENE.gb/GECG01013887.1/~~gb/GECG01013887.1/.p1  ORF type:complete len:491 (+),score=41.52 gb/GECG01013887.1/:1-1473(+)
MAHLAASNSAFEPSNAVKWFHDNSRWNKHFHSISNDFPDISNHDETETWFKGIVWHAAAIIGVGAGLTLVIFIGYMAACCCCKPEPSRQPESVEQLLDNRQNQVSHKQPPPYNRKRLITIVVLSLVYLAIGFSVFKPVRVLSVKYHDGLKAITSTKDTLSEAKTDASKAEDPLEEAVDATEKIVDCADAEDFYNNVTSAWDHTQGALTGLKQLVHHLDPVVDHGEDSRHTGKEFSYNVAGLLCFTVIVLLFTMIPCRPCSIGYKGCSVPLNLLLLLLLWVTTAMVFTVGTMFSDFCYNPDGNAIKSIKGATSNSSLSARSVEFYVHCNPSMHSEDRYGGIIFFLSEASDRTSDALNEFERVNETVHEQCSGNITNNFERVYADLKEASNHLRTTEDKLSCRAIQGNWHDFRGTFCNDVITKGIVPLLGVLTALSVLLSIILMFGWTVCVQHPGKRREHQYNAEVNGTQIEGTGFYDRGGFNVQESYPYRG